MKNAQILGSRDIKKINEMITHQFGFSFGKAYSYIENAKGKIFIISRDLDKIAFERLRTDRFGLYIGERGTTQIRLSLEGVQLLASLADLNNVKLENVVAITSKEMNSYFQGIDLTRPTMKENKLILLKYRSDIFACAPLKEGKVFNFLPKTYRGTVIL
jgi:NOL1/NOP2/fmu family ribosome biogenesis protein